MVRETSSDFLRIDLSAGKIRKIISVCQGDSVHRTVHFSIVNNGIPIDLSNVFYAEILIDRVDGTKTDNPCIIDGDDIQYTLKSTDAAVIGENEAHLYLTFNDGTHLETPVFYINVYSTKYDPDALSSENDYGTIVQQALIATEAAETATAKEALATSSATSAENSATSAATNAALAAEAAETATTKATAAATSAAAAADSASTATTKASEASESATTATTKASEAASSATTASSGASTATTNATAASNSADAAATSAATATAKAEAASASEGKAKEYADKAEEAYQKMGEDALVLGETSSTAYRGDRGKIAYEDSQTNKANIGNLASLLTTVKTSLVAAINEHVSQVGVANGIAQLDSYGKVLSSQLPSYVDDVLEGYLNTNDGKFYETYESGVFSNEITGESSKIYVDKISDNTFRWSGSLFAEISQSIALGETSSTAYRGDKGKIAYDTALASALAIGTLSSLTTSDASSLVAAINELVTRVADLENSIGYPIEPTASNNE